MNNACASMMFGPSGVFCSQARPLLSALERCSRAQSFRCLGKAAVSTQVPSRALIERQNKNQSVLVPAARLFTTSSYVFAAAKIKGQKSKKSIAGKKGASLQSPGIPARSGVTKVASKPVSENVPTQKWPSDQAVAKNTATSQPEPAQETWRDYDPEGGLPLGRGELSTGEIKQVFGDEMTVDMGNYILNVINWRRQSGSLIDEGVRFPPEMQVTQEEALAALEYLRETDPAFDEEAAGKVWLEEETERIRLQMQERSVKLGIYKRNSDAEDVEEESEQGTEAGRERYGESELIKTRKQNEAAWEREQELKAAEEKQAETAAVHSTRGPLDLSGGVQPGRGLAKVDSKQLTTEQRWDQAVAWRKKLAEEAQLSKDEDDIPNLTTTQRLGPSFLLVLAVLAFCAWLSETYTEVPASARLFPDTPRSLATLVPLTALLAVTLLIARYPRLYWLTFRYMSISPARPYAFSLLGAMFQHSTFKHLASNLLVLWLVGPAFINDVGRGDFFAVLLACGVVGGFSSMAFEVLRGRLKMYIIGASSGILGMFAAFCTVHPNRRVRIFGYEVPMAMWMLVALNLVVETVGLLSPVVRGIDFLGHIAGQVMGVVAGLYIRRKNELRGEKDFKEGSVMGRAV